MKWRIYSVVLAAYAVFTLLDAFVIPRDVVEMSSVQVTYDDASDGTDASGTGEVTVTDNSYESDNISIRISTLREYDTQIYVADVTIKDVSYLRAGLANGVFGRNVKAATSTIASECGAILAINGDFYGFRENGFVLRNGYLYRSSARAVDDDDALVIYDDGSMDIVSENESDAGTLATSATQIFSFGPGLIKDGNILVDSSSEVEQAMRSNPRTAIGQISPLHYILVVSDGRTSESSGLSLVQLAEVCREQGCELAYNLDGGGSSTMWFMGRVINNPTTTGKSSSERSVSDIVYIGE